MTRVRRYQVIRFAKKFAADCLRADADSFDPNWDLTGEEDELVRATFRTIADKLEDEAVGP